MSSQNKKNAIIYISVYFIFASLLFIFLRHRSSLATETQIDQLILTKSSFSPKTDDPCSNTLRGDPMEFKDDYFKINLFCQPGIQKSSTIVFPAIPSDITIINGLKELARVLNFDISYENNQIISMGKYLNTTDQQWYCSSSIGDFLKPVNFEDQITSKEIIECAYLSKSELNNYYQQKLSRLK